MKQQLGVKERFRRGNAPHGSRPYGQIIMTNAEISGETNPADSLSEASVLPYQLATAVPLRTEAGVSNR